VCGEDGKTSARRCRGKRKKSPREVRISFGITGEKREWRNRGALADLGREGKNRQGEKGENVKGSTNKKKKHPLLETWGEKGDNPNADQRGEPEGAPSFMSTRKIFHS